MNSTAARRIVDVDDSHGWTPEELGKLRRQKERIASEIAEREGTSLEAALAKLNDDLRGCSEEGLHLIAAQDDIDPEEPRDPEERARLNALIAESDAAHARGESVPFEVLFDDIDRGFADR
jgi:hypothetical protein